MNDKYGDKYRVHNLVKFDYSEIGKYIDENHTDKPLRNDEIVDLLNEQEKRINKLKETIIKITLSYHQKHDNTIANLVDEVYEEDIGDLFIEWKDGDRE